MLLTVSHGIPLAGHMVNNDGKISTPYIPFVLTYIIRQYTHIHIQININKYAHMKIWKLPSWGIDWECGIPLHFDARLSELVAYIASDTSKHSHTRKHFSRACKPLETYTEFYAFQLSHGNSIKNVQLPFNFQWSRCCLLTIRGNKPICVWWVEFFYFFRIFMRSLKCC